MQEKYFNSLFNIAQSIEPVRRARLAAALVFKNEVISVGYNQKKSHPFQRRFCKNDEAIFLHAETDAIKNALRNYDLKTVAASTMYVLRVKQANGKFTTGMAKPCSGCQRALAQYDINRVYYTTDDIGIFEQL